MSCLILFLTLSVQGLKIAKHFYHYASTDYKVRIEVIIFWTYTALNLTLLVIYAFLVKFFYKTSVHFVEILKYDRDLSLSRAKCVFGLLSAILFLANITDTMNNILHPLNRLYFDLKYCTLVKWTRIIE